MEGRWGEGTGDGPKEKGWGRPCSNFNHEGRGTKGVEGFFQKKGWDIYRLTERLQQAEGPLCGWGLWESEKRQDSEPGPGKGVTLQLLTQGDGGGEARPTPRNSGEGGGASPGSPAWGGHP